MKILMRVLQLIEYYLSLRLYRYQLNCIVFLFLGDEQNTGVYTKTRAVKKRRKKSRIHATLQNNDSIESLLVEYAVLSSRFPQANTHYQRRARLTRSAKVNKKLT